MWARDGDDVLKELEGGLKDSKNKREQRSGAPSTVCLFVYLLCAIRHHQAQHAASPVDMRSRISPSAIFTSRRPVLRI